MDFWRNVALGDVNFADVDEIIDIKIDRRKSSDWKNIGAFNENKESLYI